MFASDSYLWLGLGVAAFGFFIFLGLNTLGHKLSKTIGEASGRWFSIEKDCLRQEEDRMTVARMRKDNKS